MANSKLLLNSPLSIDNLIVYLCNNYKNNTNDIVKHHLKKKVESILKMRIYQNNPLLSHTPLSLALLFSKANICQWQ